MFKCEYIFKKGKLKGHLCNKQCQNKFCITHKPKEESFSVILKNIKIICDNWFENKQSTKYYNFIKHSRNLYNNTKINSKDENILIQISGLPFQVPKIQDIIQYKGLEIRIPQKINKWVLGKKLGRGGFGIVYECFDITNPSNCYAIKLECKNSTSLLIENKLYNNLKTKYIPKIFDSGTFKNLRFIVMEKLNVFKMDINKIPEIIYGLYVLHKKNIIHGDLKCSNIMCRQNMEIVFIDFGLSAKVIDCKSNYKNIFGTLTYMSINAHYGIISFQNDLESLVYVLLEMCGELPWSSNEYNFEDLFKVLDIKESFKNKIISKDKETINKFFILKYKIVYDFVIYILTLQQSIPDYDLLYKFFIKK